MDQQTTFISWSRLSRRSQQIADGMGMRLHVVHTRTRHAALLPARYVLQSWRTWRILGRERPDVVFVQNPPIVAVVVVYLHCRARGARFVIDSHTGALIGRRWGWSRPLHAVLSRRALATVVTNDHLREIVAHWRAPAFVLADVPASLPRGEPYPVDRAAFTVAMVNTFAPDEPLDAVLEAAHALPEVRFYVTGDPSRARRAVLQARPANVCFTGFLPDDQYIGLLRSVGAIMSLTTRDHTMQRGACEAVWLGKPVITSDWPLLREFFPKGAVHVDNSVGGISSGVRTMGADLRRFEQEMLELREQRRREWAETEAALRRLIAPRSLSGTATG